MAKVMKKVVTVESMTLTLNTDEFAYLCTIIGRTGGSPVNSLRKAASSIVSAIEDAGMDYEEFACPAEVDEENVYAGSIYFKDVR